MHSITLKAMKAANISGMSRNYPDDKHQRGATYWSGFIAALEQQLAEQDEYIKSLLDECKSAAVESKKDAKEIRKLEKTVARKTVEAVASEHNFAPEVTRALTNSAN